MEKSLYSAEHATLLSLLKKARLQAGLRQKDVADKIQRPQSFVSKYESGERRLDLLELREICRALGMSLESFVRSLERALARKR